MLLVSIANLCAGFIMVGAVSLPMREAKRVEYMANVCKNTYRSCLKRLEVKQYKNGRHYNVRCK